MAEPETTNTIMLDQAQVDAAEAAQAAQENGGEEGDYIGRRPSSSGRDSKRYRKYPPRCILTVKFSPAPPPWLRAGRRIHHAE